jgi:hypothetical protein
VFIFLDESGNLGFDSSKSNNTKYFIVTILVFYAPEIKKLIELAVKRTIKKINGKKGKNAIVKELKGTDTTIRTKAYFYRQLPQDGWEIYSVILNKDRVYSHLHTKTGKKKLYNFLSKFVLRKVKFPDNIKYVNLIVDRCKPKKDDIKDFNKYIESSLYSSLPIETITFINHEDSCNAPCLQAVDMFCWGIARKYTHNDEEWYSIFKDKILFEEKYLP